MNIQTQNIFRTTFPVKDDECVGRHLVSVYATPNPSGGGCDVITLTFQLLGWSPGDLPETFVWDETNTGQTYTLGSCIDITTLDYNGCIGRIVFTWNDGIECCP